MELLERDRVLERLEALFVDAREDSGKIVVVRGEAGIGKTSVVKIFCDAHEEDAHVLRGACDDLLTPQPLGPIWDMSLEEPSLEKWLFDDNRQRVFRGVQELLARSLRPTVMVIEDVHWADESTTDLIRYVGRRIARTNGLLILTFRDKQLAGNDPVQLALGDLPHGAVEQIPLHPLTKEAVSRLAGDVWDADELWRLTDGNPFMVGELLEAGPTAVPVSVRDAMRARMLRLSSRGRELVELASVVPGGVDLDLIDEILTNATPAIAECESVGILQVEGPRLAFRHELARRAIESDLPEIHKRKLSMSVLGVLEAGDEDVAICAHFARESGDGGAILRLLPRAARRAVELGSRREALAHLRALEPFLDGMNRAERADHYDLWAREEHYGEGTDAEDLLETAIGLRRSLGVPTSLGKTLLLAAEIYWWRGKRKSAVESAEEAAAILEGVGGEDLAMAYSTLARLAMVAADLDPALYYAGKALAELDDGPSPVRVHALNNRGSAIADARYPDGLEDLEESYRMAGELGLSFDQARAAHNIGWVALEADRDTLKARRWLGDAMELVEGAEMPGVAYGAVTGLAWTDELRGDWDAAEHRAQYVIDDPGAGIYRATAAFVLARVLTRSGRPDAEEAAVDAWKRAQRADEPQFLSPTGSVVLELSWLGGGEADRGIVDEVVEGYRRHASLRDRPTNSELAFWLSVLGKIEEVPETALEPFVSLDRGDWRAAAAFWDERDIPYEKALCLSYGDTDAKLEALTIVDRLGAVPLAKKVRDELRAGGVDHVPRGPIQATQQSRLGLTPRQTEVLGLLAEDLTNAEIAERLFVSTRTVESHVSAILAKLSAESRLEAGAIARQRGLLPEG